MGSCAPLRLWSVVVLLALSCKAPDQTQVNLFTEGSALGINENVHLEEASGLAASDRHPGFLWAHNDSGHSPKLFLLDSACKTRATIRVQGIKNRDWEDIALGPGPGSTNLIYIGDIGDNYGQQKVKKIYCVEEPAIDFDGELPVIFALTVKMSDRPRDTEALMVDPWSKNIYLITKREKKVHLYEIKFPFTQDTLKAERLKSLPMHQVVAADISADGTEVLVKTYDRIFYWTRLSHESIPDALAKDPVELPYQREGMGESIAWARDGSGFYTLGENAKGKRAPLYFYKRLKQDTIKR